MFRRRKFQKIKRRELWALRAKQIYGWCNINDVQILSFYLRSQLSVISLLINVPNSNHNSFQIWLYFLYTKYNYLHSGYDKIFLLTNSLSQHSLLRFDYNFFVINLLYLLFVIFRREYLLSHLFITVIYSLIPLVVYFTSV